MAGGKGEGNGNREIVAAVDEAAEEADAVVEVVDLADFSNLQP